MSAIQQILDEICLHISRIEEGISKLSEEQISIDATVQYMTDVITEYHRLQANIADLNTMLGKYDAEFRATLKKLADDNRIPRGVLKDSYGGCVNISETTTHKKILDIQRFFKENVDGHRVLELKAEANAKKEYDKTTLTVTDIASFREQFYAGDPKAKAKARADAKSYVIEKTGKQTVISAFADIADCMLHVHGEASEEE